MNNTTTLIVLGVLGLIVLGIIWYVITRFLVNVGATEVAIKERRYMGRRMPQGRVVATEGEVGIQADVLKPGLHFVWYPIERVINKVPLVEIGADELGVIEAIDGEPMQTGYIFAPDRAQNAHNNFQDPIAFIKQGGVKGIQLRTLPPGKWAIHPYLFNVSIAKVTVIPPGNIGVVTSADGAQLEPGRLHGSAIEGHKNFQDAESFVYKGGQKGPQVETLTPGTYRIHTQSIGADNSPQPGLFTIRLFEATKISENQIGLVEALDGAPLDPRDYVAQAVTGHDNYQDSNTFISGGGQRGCRQDDTRRTQAIEQWNEDQAAGRGANQIGRIHRVDVRGKPRDGQRDRQAAGEEGQRGQSVDGQHQRQIAWRVVETDAQAHEEKERHDRAGRVEQRGPRQELVGGPALEASSCDIRAHAAGAHPEEGDRNREEREVVVHDDREDPRQRELGHQQRARDQRHAGEVPPVRMFRHPPGVYHSRQDDLADPDSSSRVRRRIGDLVGRPAAGGVRLEPAASCDTGLSAVVRDLPRRQSSVSSASGTIIFLVGIADAGVRAVHGHLRGRGDRCARVASRGPAESFPPPLAREARHVSLGPDAPHRFDRPGGRDARLRVDDRSHARELDSRRVGPADRRCRRLDRAVRGPGSGRGDEVN